MSFLLLSVSVFKTGIPSAQSNLSETWKSVSKISHRISTYITNPQSSKKVQVNQPGKLTML